MGRPPADWPAVRQTVMPVAADAAPADGGAAAALGNNADFVLKRKKTLDIHAILPPPGTVKAWYLRSQGRDLLKRNGVDRRLRWCGSRISRNVQGVGVYSRPDRAYGRVSGVCVCGQSLCCPVCAPRIAAKRGAEVAEAFSRAKDAGFEARLETFTKPHKLDFRPCALLEEFKLFSDLWRAFSKNADRRERGTEGHHLGREVNWGNENGWHYHHHRLRYDRPGTFDESATRLQWIATLSGRGFESDALYRRAYDCSPVSDDVGARYVAKLATSVEAQARAIGSEIASAVTKGRNLNSLLADYASGDLNAGAVWVNGVACVTASKVSSVRWSRGLRYKLGMADGQTDEQISAEEITKTDEFLGSLNPMQWRGILRYKAEFALCVAANKGADAVNEFLTGLELGNLDDEAPPAVQTPIKGDYAYARL